MLSKKELEMHRNKMFQLLMFVFVIFSCFCFCFALVMSIIRLVMEVYLHLNTLEFSGIRR